MIGCFIEACCCRVTLDDDYDYDYDEDASVQFVYFLIAQLSFPVMLLQQHFRYRAKQMTSAVSDCQMKSAGPFSQTVVTCFNLTSIVNTAVCTFTSHHITKK